MSHSSVLNSKQSTDNMKIKVGAAFTAVVVGHIAVLWALGQMKPHEIKTEKKVPIQAHFVKIQQPPKPLPEPKEPPKPKKEVKEVKIVKNPPPPPKKVEKVQQVKKAEQPKKEVQQVEKPQPVVVPPVVSTVETKPVPQPEPAPTPAPTPQPAPAAEPAEKTPKSVSIGGSGVQWSLSPKPSYEQSDLRGSPRSIVVMIEADEKGKIISVTVVQSSGVPALDQKILRAVRGAKFKPYMENGVAYPIKAQQPFDLS
ncbi:TonB family protein [Acinetobacter sp. B5B]|uniref:energy transducer TonB n=1 Tax=Acinetobacter baretiae TaxID=2605383 RepID=UPI0018C2BD39|nr:energy transducer TonB [Acinetobacter baretiae]MBF7683592.1 TonB family protein [Acinetobacter baretiae]MBF7686422.1 TonB family protein [Acinetobacter baretiae]